MEKNNFSLFILVFYVEIFNKAYSLKDHNDKRHISQFIPYHKDNNTSTYYHRYHARRHYVPLH